VTPNRTKLFDNEIHVDIRRLEGEGQVSNMATLHLIRGRNSESFFFGVSPREHRGGRRTEKLPEERGGGSAKYEQAATRCTCPGTVEGKQIPPAERKAYDEERKQTAILGH